LTLIYNDFTMALLTK